MPSVHNFLLHEEVQHVELQTLQVGALWALHRLMLQHQPFHRNGSNTPANTRQQSILLLTHLTQGALDFQIEPTLEELKHVLSEELLQVRLQSFQAGAHWHCFNPFHEHQSFSQEWFKYTCQYFAAFNLINDSPDPKCHKAVLLQPDSRYRFSDSSVGAGT